MLILLLLALRATSADENDVYASDDNFVSPTQRADETEAARRPVAVVKDERYERRRY